MGPAQAVSYRWRWRYDVTSGDSVAAVRLYGFKTKPLRAQRFVDLVNTQETSIARALYETRTAPMAEHLLTSRHTITKRTWLQKALARG